MKPARTQRYASGSAVWGGVVGMALVGISRSYGIDIEHNSGMRASGVSQPVERQPHALTDRGGPDLTVHFSTFDALSTNKRRSRLLLTSPQPEEPDVWLTLTVGGVRFHFVACLTAALVFICDLQQHRLADTVRVSDSGPADVPRLPNEILFLEP
ncbi:hypothetical protein [Nocardia sp. NPDC057455]|uniref:hypothetical protein n=1 Tax=Nocardia sp. NPDC057455 TaxID=3346138 RepID=UPI00366BD1CA